MHQFFLDILLITLEILRNIQRYALYPKKCVFIDVYLDMHNTFFYTFSAKLIVNISYFYQTTQYKYENSYNSEI